nr:SURF1 family protein [Cochlodiniinecator piscidefendens]
MIFPMVFGLIGTAILISLGVWQIQRLQWKESVLAEIDSFIAAPAIPLEHALSQPQDYQPVEVRGHFTGDAVHVLISVKNIGPAYRIVEGFVTESGRRILVDRGFVRDEHVNRERPSGEAVVIGNLHTPVEVDGYTPEPDLDANIWFARDADAIAEVLNTEPVFVILRETSEINSLVTPLPVDSSAISNDHLGYAVTWFSLAIIWFGMTSILVWRIRRNVL